MSADSDNKVDKLKKELERLCLRISAIKSKKAQDETNNNPHGSKLDCEGYKNKQIMQTSKRSRDQTRRKKPTSEDTSSSSPIHPDVRDINDKVIQIGNRVRFITKGLHNSTEGTVYKISKNGRRVTSWDDKGMPISRVPYNLQIIRH